LVTGTEMAALTEAAAMATVTIKPEERSCMMISFGLAAAKFSMNPATRAARPSVPRLGLRGKDGSGESKLEGTREDHLVSAQEGLTLTASQNLVGNCTGNSFTLAPTSHMWFEIQTTYVHSTPNYCLRCSAWRIRSAARPGQRNATGSPGNGQGCADRRPRFQLRFGHTAP
jgi:hypothetical protein